MLHFFGWDTQDFITVGLIVLVAMLAAYRLGRIVANCTEYVRGWQDGYREERTRRNRVIIPRVMDAFKKGRIVERAHQLWASRN